MYPLGIQINRGIVDYNENIPVGNIIVGTLANPSYFEGQTLDGKTPAGLGRFHGDFGLYQGPFADGRPYGFGIFFSKDNYIYIGNFKDGKVHGYGKVVTENFEINGEWL